MNHITLAVPDETLLALQVSPKGLAAELRLAAPVKLYEMRQLSSEAAAALAGLPKLDFLPKLGDYRATTFRFSGEELCEDLELSRASLAKSPCRPKTHQECRHLQRGR